MLTCTNEAFDEVNLTRFESSIYLFRESLLQVVPADAVGYDSKGEKTCREHEGDYVQKDKKRKEKGTLEKVKKALQSIQKL
jgi:hypothetical protein